VSGPAIYEINTAVWLGGRRLDEADWDAVASLPVDAVWLMGVWRRSPAGLEIARADPQLDAGMRAALPDLRDADVIGSPYCVRDYVVDDRFGGPEALAHARAELKRRGLGLILDFVPNHVAPDHPWLQERPGCLIAGSEEELAADPRAFVRTPGGIFARGRDPYFPPWPDVVQLNAFAAELREAVAETLDAIASQCDGVRCDMAMLMTNEVFARTWGDRAGAVPAQEYWPALIERTKRAHPDFRFIAEAYWDMEWALQQQGFDHCYDKRLYDRLAHEDAEAVRGHLRADPAYQERLIRFIENHDEPRAAATFPPARARAAAVVFSTLLGARLFHDGQLEGRRVHIPVFLARGPSEPPDDDLRGFYDRLLRAVAGLRGEWRMCETSGWPDNQSHRALLAWCWDRTLVVVNFGAAAAQGRVHLPWDGEWDLTDLLSGAGFRRAGDELYVELEPWGFHFLAFG
jgi:hypothetical protein